MASLFQHFTALHRRDEPLLLPNAWNVQSAQAFEKMGFTAVATSSAAVAASLGYADGEAMPFADYLFMIRRMAGALAIPLSVDLEAGYSDDPAQVAQHIWALAGLGVAGINIEDSAVAGTTRRLQDALLFSKKLEHIRRLLAAENTEMFINVRSDTFLLDVPEKKEETARRIKLYEAAGADGIFLPCLRDAQDIAEMAKVASRPLNVMCVPALPAFGDLQAAGVRRISMGDFLFKYIYQSMEETAKRICEDRSFSCLFSADVKQAY